MKAEWRIVRSREGGKGVGEEAGKIKGRGGEKGRKRKGKEERVRTAGLWASAAGFSSTTLRTVQSGASSGKSGSSVKPWHCMSRVCDKDPM